MRSRKKGKLQLKFLMGLIAMTVVLMITLCFVITRQYRSSMESYYTKMAFDQAKIAAEYIDGDTIKDYALTFMVTFWPDCVPVSAGALWDASPFGACDAVCPPVPPHAVNNILPANNAANILFFIFKYSFS